MKLKNIEQEITFDASPEAVYDLLMNAEKHAAFTNGPVEMSQEKDGTFSIYDGYIHGRNIELQPGKKIVQHWHFAEDGWPDDHFSTCTFDLSKDGNGCKLHFTQTGIPAHKLDDLTDGWEKYYWSPMKEYLNNRG